MNLYSEENGDFCKNDILFTAQTNTDSQAIDLLPFEDEMEINIRSIECTSPDFDLLQNDVREENMNSNSREFWQDRQECVFDPSQLKKKFTAVTFEKKKATNAPKHFIKLFYKEIYNMLPLDHDFQEHKNYLDRFKEEIAAKPKNRKHLQYLFGEGKTNKEKQWNETHRKCLKKKLKEDKFEEILDNNMIPKGNKLHYLFFSKVYEWRMNDPKLIARFQS